MKIFITRNIPAPGIDKLRSVGHEVIVSDKPDALTRDELEAALKKEDPDAVICLLTDKIDGRILDAAPKAKIFANYAVGFDNIDLEELKKRGVAASNTPDVLTEAVAEHTVALALSIGRRVVESDHFLRDGQYEGWDPMLLLGIEFKGKTLGIVGCGRIGQRVGEIMHRGFGMKIAYYDQKPNVEFENSLSAAFFPDLDQLLNEADIVTVHLPLTDGTRHLFDKDRLSKMKPSAFLVNTARGAIIDEAALASTLREKKIAGAALDVFESEPTVHPDLLSLQNLVITPHIASATIEAREQMSIMSADNVIAVLNGETPPHQVL